MIHFTDLPAVDLEAPKLIRVKPGNPLRVKLLNKKFVGLETHYWGGHTVACPGTDTCKACGSGLISTYAGFIFCQCWEGGRIGVLVLTPVMCANVTLHVAGNKGLLGMRVSFARKTKEPNSGVRSTFHGFDSENDEQTQERLVMRVRIIFKDYVIKSQVPTDDTGSQRLN